MHEFPPQLGRTLESYLPGSPHVTSLTADQKQCDVNLILVVYPSLQMQLHKANSPPRSGRPRPPAPPNDHDGVCGTRHPLFLKNTHGRNGQTTPSIQTPLCSLPVPRARSNLRHPACSFVSIYIFFVALAVPMWVLCTCGMLAWKQRSGETQGRCSPSSRTADLSTSPSGASRAG